MTSGSSTLLPEMIIDRLLQQAQAWRAVLPDVRHRQATADPQEQELNAVTYLRQVLGPSPKPSQMFLLNDVAGLRRC